MNKVFYTFKVYDGVTMHNVAIDLYSICEVVVANKKDDYYSRVWTSSTNYYDFNEEQYLYLVKAMEREGIKMYDSLGNLDYNK